jgi:alkylhydroperoxidase/carboxymuconolactone decarboxylase family protein YurZ
MARKRKEVHTVLIKLDSKVYSAFLHREKVTHSDRALPKKTKELIAAGISVKINCESCMK